MKTEQGGGKKYVPAAGRLCWGEEGDIVSLWGRGGHKQRPRAAPPPAARLRPAPRAGGWATAAGLHKEGFRPVPESSGRFQLGVGRSRWFLTIPEGSGGFCATQCQGNSAFMAV